jgi:hypothetical protein
MKKKNTPEEEPLKSRDLGDGKYEVCGIEFYADSHAEALRKYRRAKKEYNEI